MTYAADYHCPTTQCFEIPKSNQALQVKTFAKIVRLSFFEKIVQCWTFPCQIVHCAAVQQRGSLAP